MQQMIQTTIDFAAKLIWPLFFVWFLHKYGTDLRALLPRIRKLGSSGVELEISASTQKTEENSLLNDKDYNPKMLKDFAGLSRSKAIADLEIALHKTLDDKVMKKELEDVDKVDFLVRELAISRLVSHFQAVYNLIFGSQIRALQILNQHGSLPIGEAQLFFASVKSADSSFYGEYKFEDWLRFLIQANCVTVDNDLISLTPTGFDFLQFLLASRLNTAKRG